jgi:hypothetical protein
VSTGWKLRADVPDDACTLAIEEARFPPGIGPAPALAAKVREQHPEADVEEFETPTGSAVGLLGTVIGYSCAARDIDTAAALTAVMACRMRAVR